MLSHIDITRERLAHNPKRQACRRDNTRACKRPDERLWYFYREYAFSNGKNRIGGMLVYPIIGEHFYLLKTLEKLTIT